MLANTDTEPTDAVWAAIRHEARLEEQRGSCMCQFLSRFILAPPTLEDSLATLLSSKLAAREVCGDRLLSLILHVFQASPEIQRAIRQDLRAVVDRDPV